MQQETKCMNSNRITEVPVPISGTDAVNKNYVDRIKTVLDEK